MFFSLALLSALTSIPEPQELALPASASGSFTVEIAFDGAPRTVALFASSVRSPGYRLRVRRPAGGFEDLPPAPPATYRGSVEGWPHARVAGSLLEDGLHLSVFGAPQGESWTVQPAERETSGGNAHHVMRSDHADLEGFTCGTVAGSDPSADLSTSSNALAPPNSIRVAEIAIDVDYEYFARVGGLNATQAAVDDLVLRMGVFYEFYFGVNYELTGTVVADSPAVDPYFGLPFGCCWLGLNCAGSAESTLISEWQPGNHPGIARDTVHLMSGVIDTGPYGGCASTRICTSRAFSWSAGFDLAGPRRLLVLAHELGHLWGACHCNVSSCDNYDPDDCGIMRNGFPKPFFGEGVHTALANIAAKPCLHDGSSNYQPPVLTSVTPEDVEILGGPVVLRGQHFDQALFVDWAGTRFLPGEFHVTGSDEIRLEAPVGTVHGPQAVDVLGPGGSSSVRFDYVACQTPNLVADKIWIDIIPFFSGLVTWTYCGPVGSEALLLASRSAVTTPINGFDMLAYGNVLDQRTLSGLGVEEFSAAFPNTAAVGEDFRVQLVIFDASGQLIGVSEVLCHYLGTGCQPNPCGLDDDC